MTPLLGAPVPLPLLLAIAGGRGGHPVPALPALPSLPPRPPATPGFFSASPRLLNSPLPGAVAPGVNAAMPLMDRSYSLVNMMLLAMTYAGGFEDLFEPYTWTAMMSGMI